MPTTKKKKSDKLFIALVSHRHGNDVIVAKSRGGVTKLIAGYVRDWWSEMAGNADAYGNNVEVPVPEKPPRSSKAAISIYFQNCEEDYEVFEFNMREIPD